MTTDTLTLTDFLFARIAEDEEDARGYSDDGSPGTWRHWGEAVCASHREIVEEFAPCVDDGDGYAAAARNALSYLAAVYADHPDYRDEWRP